MSTQQDGDRLVEAYLTYLTEAAEPLPAERRTDLIAEVTAHIADARAAGATSDQEIRAMLKRLGDPDDIVASATDGLVLVDRYRPRFRSREIGALLLVPFGGFIFGVGWLLGLFLLWTSDRWTRGEKWLATLVWPLGYVGVVVANTYPEPEGVHVPPALGVAVGILIALAPLAVLVKLIKNAQPGRSHLA
jgi:hypothetical protein